MTPVAEAQRRTAPPRQRQATQRTAPRSEQAFKELEAKALPTAPPPRVRLVEDKPRVAIVE
jgi:hypothetical protein